MQPRPILFCKIIFAIINNGGKEYDRKKSVRKKFE